MAGRDLQWSPRQQKHSGTPFREDSPKNGDFPIPDCAGRSGTQASEFPSGIFGNENSLISFWPLLNGKLDGSVETKNTIPGQFFQFFLLAEACIARSHGKVNCTIINAIKGRSIVLEGNAPITFRVVTIVKPPGAGTE